MDLHIQHGPVVYISRQICLLIYGFTCSERRGASFWQNLHKAINCQNTKYTTKCNVWQITLKSTRKGRS